MTDRFRIQNPAGDWLIARAAGAFRRPWLCSDFIEGMTLAAGLPSAPEPLRSLEAILARIPQEPGPDIALRHTPATAERYAKRSVLIEREVREMLTSPLSHDYDPNRTPAAIEAAVQKELKRLRTQMAPKKTQSWAFAVLPRDLSWTSDPGKATLMTRADAEALIERCARLQAIASALPKALRQAHALGAEIDPHCLPDSDKLHCVVGSVAQASIAPFQPAQEYLTRQCFALYAERGSSKGFATSKCGELKPDLASARLFPSIELAERGARHRFTDYAIVTVDVSPLRFETRGSPGSLLDLASAISAKEALEIELAIANAGVERLRAELLAREEKDLGGSTPAPAPAPRARL